ncbi:uncharacterized protein LOC143646627 isoform X2 [Tamandua tetradactyla]
MQKKASFKSKHENHLAFPGTRLRRVYRARSNLDIQFPEEVPSQKWQQALEHAQELVLLCRHYHMPTFLNAEESYKQLVASGPGGLVSLDNGLEQVNHCLRPLSVGRWRTLPV